MYRLSRLFRVVSRRDGLVVQSGPFASMKYTSRAVGSSLLPKLLGSYEAELHGVLVQILDNKYDTVVDIGCAEGYYAVGLAMRLPTARVFAFDVEPTALRLCSEMAATNEVKARVAVEGECKIDRLQSLTEGRALVICDCEGCEYDLLRPDLAPNLKSTDILVELHDFIDPRITTAIFERFASTHDISLINSEERDPLAYSALRDFSPMDQRMAVAEFRDGKMQWGWLRAKENAQTDR